MTPSLSAALQAIATPRLLVLGDYLLERTTWGNAERISPEAPVMVLRTDRRQSHAGGAGSVCTMLRALNAEVAAIGVVGGDEAGRELRNCLTAAGVNDAALCHDSDRTTPLADCFIGRAAMRHAHQILRVDEVRPTPVVPAIEQAVIAQIESSLAGCQALLISDHGRGSCSPELVRRTISAASESGCPVLIDPGETADYSAYRGTALVTPNRRQAQMASGIEIRRPKDALLAGCWLCETFGLAAVAVKLDKDGLALATADGVEVIFPTRSQAVYDVTGARDMVLAAFGLCLAAGLPLEQAAPLANLAAGLKIEKQGPACVTRDEILLELAQHETGLAGKLVTLEQMARLADGYRKQNRRVVFTNGCFDLLHVGHVTYLQQAAALGEVLVVGINSDSSVRGLKGPQRPIYNQQVRSAMLAALGCVDHVLVFDDATPHALLWAIRPDVLVKGGTYSEEQVVGREVVLAYGGRVCVAGMVEGVSTTDIVSAVRRRETPCRLG